MSIKRIKRTAVVMIGDLSLLASLYLAHFIVWRTLRARYRERVARLKNLKLINGRGQAPTNKDELITGNHEDGEQERTGNSGFMHHG